MTLPFRDGVNARTSCVCGHQLRDHELVDNIRVAGECSGACGCTEFREQPPPREEARPKRKTALRPRGLRGALRAGEPDDSGIRLREQLRKGERILPVGEVLPLLGRDPAKTSRSGDTPDQLSSGFHLRQALRPLQISRSAGCGVLRIAGAVEIRVEAGGRVRTGGLRRCANVFACPTCAAFICHQKATEVMTACDQWRARGGVLRLLTLTVGHERGVNLEVERRVLTTAHRRLFSGRPGAALKEALCIEYFARGLDATWGELNGWHGHLHSVLFMTGEPEAHVPEALACRWRESVAWAIEERRKEGDDVRGIKLPGRDRDGVERGARLDELNRDDYLLKLGLEVVSMITKQGKLGRSLNPWAIAQRAAAGELKFQRLWVDWTEAMHGARQLFWSHGAREFFGLGKEKSDQERVDAKGDAPAEPLGVITIEKEVWDPSVRRFAWHEGLVRAERSREPITALVEHLLKHGARVNRTGPGRWVASASPSERAGPGNTYGARRLVAEQSVRQRAGPSGAP